MNRKENEDMIENTEVKMGRHFTLEYWQDEGWYVGRLKEIPGIFSQGETLNELKTNVLDAYNLVLEESKESLPANIKNKVRRIQVEL
ncbi:MAG: type II toxin-antitoxin system HicB family antitoxin [Candidatus Aminicenantes bacterium]